MVRVLTDWKGFKGVRKEKNTELGGGGEMENLKKNLKTSNQWDDPGRGKGEMGLNVY